MSIQYAVTWREENALIIESKKNELFGGKLRRQIRMNELWGNWDMSKIGRKDRKYDIKWRKGEKNEIRMGKVKEKEENWRWKRQNQIEWDKVPKN